MTRILSVFMLAVAAFSGVAQAQGQPSVQPSGVPRQPSGRNADATQEATAAEQQGRVARVSELVGMDVVTENGDSLGTIEDLMIDKRTGQIEYVLAAASKDSESLSPLPWKTLSWYQGDDPKDQYLILGMQREQFEKAPVVYRQQWPTMTYPQWNTVLPQVTDFYRPIRPAETRAVRRATRAIRRAQD